MIVELLEAAVDDGDGFACFWIFGGESEDVAGDVDSVDDVVLNW